MLTALAGARLDGARHVGVCESLLNNREQIPRMGAAGREHVRRTFLITRQLLDYLALMVHLTA